MCAYFAGASSIVQVSARQHTGGVLKIPEGRPREVRADRQRS